MQSSTALCQGRTPVCKWQGGGVIGTLTTGRLALKAEEEQKQLSIFQDWGFQLICLFERPNDTETEAEIKKGRERERSNQEFMTPNVHNGQHWSSQSQELCSDPPCARSPYTWTILGCFPRYISRELNWKQSSQDPSQDSGMGCQPHEQQLSTLLTCFINKCATSAGVRESAGLEGDSVAALCLLFKKGG